MFKSIVLMLAICVSLPALGVTGQPTGSALSMQERIEAAVASGYSVGVCRDGECHDYETKEPILIDNYDQDGFYIYWDENKPNRPKMDDPY